MKILPKEAKVDIGLVGQALNNANATGLYYHMAKYRRAMAVLIDGASAATKTTKVEFLQAQDAAGTGAKGIPDDAGQLAKAEATANTKVVEATLTVAAVQVGDKVTVNGVEFTGAAAADLPNHVFLANAADNTATAASLADAINHATGGVVGVIAVAALAVVALTVTDAGEDYITITGAAATITAATTQSVAYVDLDVSQLDLANGFEYVAVKVTKTGNGTAAATLLRYIPRYEPDQKVGASAVV